METKEWYLSKTIWVSVITMVIGILVGAGVLGKEEVATEQVESLADNIIGGIVAVLGVLSFIFRFIAKTEIKKPK